MHRSIALVLWLGSTALAQEELRTPPAAGVRRLRLRVFSPKGKALDAAALLRRIGRADAASSQRPQALAAVSPDGLTGASGPAVIQEADGPALVWSGPERVTISLPWPIPEDGFSTVWIDKGGAGFSDGEEIWLNEEIALTQHRLLKESLKKRATEWQPPYKAGDKARKLAEKASKLIGRAQAESEPAARAEAFDEALAAVSIAWQKAVYEHGLQVAHNEKLRDGLRFGVTLDESFVRGMDSYKWVVETIARSGTNWVRLVFRANPQDFAYEEARSFNEYDAIVAALKSKGVRIMGCALDTTQWPRTLTPEIYARRIKNLVLRYGETIRSWEVGNEINGDWLGGPKTPIPIGAVFDIFQAGAKAVKETNPALETTATLYWWDGTAPDRAHSLFGWLQAYAPRLGRSVDVVGLSLWPEDNPVGMAFDTIFQRLHEAVPDKKLMLSSMGFVEESELKGYWWLDPEDVDAARKDLLLLYTAASCAAPKSACGGFWWQALEQMLPPDRRATDLFGIHRRALEHLGR